MKCPNCHEKMSVSYKFEKRSVIDWDGFDYDYAYMKVWIHKCKSCKIKYRQDDCSGPFTEDDKWDIPKKLRPSDKQVEYAKSIACSIGVDLDDLDLVTKKQYWKFINEHQKKYKKNREREYRNELEYIGQEMMELGLDQYDLDIFN